MYETLVNYFTLFYVFIYPSLQGLYFCYHIFIVFSTQKYPMPSYLLSYLVYKSCGLSNCSLDMQHILRNAKARFCLMFKHCLMCYVWHSSGTQNQGLSDELISIPLTSSARTAKPSLRE